MNTRGAKLVRGMNVAGLDLVERDEGEDFGPCCACGRNDGTVRNVIMLERRAPVDGTGWGCVVCRLRCDGAMYVLCDRCLQANAKPREVIHGFAENKMRFPIADLSPEKFSHNMEKHVL